MSTYFISNIHFADGEELHPRMLEDNRRKVEVPCVCITTDFGLWTELLPSERRWDEYFVYEVHASDMYPVHEYTYEYISTKEVLILRTLKHYVWTGKKNEYGERVYVSTSVCSA